MPGESTDHAAVSDRYGHLRNESYADATDSYVRGLSAWIRYDFRSERRQSALQRGWNRKGLIAEDKTTRKRAFAVLAAHDQALAKAEALPAPPTPTQPQEPEASSCSH
jgi:hypothetical protein